MAFKYIVFASVLAYASAGYLGAPVAYSAAPAVSHAYIQQAAPVSTAYIQQAAPVLAHAPLAYASPSIGASHQSVIRSPLGNQAVSTYSKAVDSAYSSVRKFDTRVTNDALIHAPIAAPVVSTYAHAPLVSSVGVAAPVLRTAAVGYSPAAVVSHASFTGLGASYAW